MVSWIFASSIFLIFIVVCYLQSLRIHPEKTLRASTYTYDTVFDVILILVAISGVMAFVEVIFPTSLISPELFTGPKLVLTAVGGTFIGSVTPGPPVLAYPVAKMMLDVGFKLGLIAAFLCGWSLMDPISLPVEIRYLGKRFALWRFAISFVLAVVIGLSMVVLL